MLGCDGLVRFLLVLSVRVFRSPYGYLVASTLIGRRVALVSFCTDCFPRFKAVIATPPLPLISTDTLFPCPFYVHEFT